MSFVDKLHLLVKSGDGGSGCVSFRREKFTPKGGPDGGDGGRGGDILIKSCSKYQSFTHLKKKSKLIAKNGENGLGKKKFGKSAHHLTIIVPIGTIVYDKNKKLIIDLNAPNKEFILCKGGKGGKGNANFATSSSQSPTYAQSGLPGEEKSIFLELRLIAQVGIVGLPNAGKSTLLKKLTHANPKIGYYPFTTLFPNLGTLRLFDQEIIIADIPGIIKGASQGDGLGFDFLRHIDRTNLLIHLVQFRKSAEDTFKDYEIVLKEFKKSELNLLEKKRIVILSQIDLIKKSDVMCAVKFFKQKKLDLYSISSFTNDGISSLIELIHNVSKTLEKF